MATDNGGPYTRPTGDGYWVENDHGFFGPYDAEDLPLLDSPGPDEIVVRVTGPVAARVGPLEGWVKS